MRSQCDSPPPLYAARILPSVGCTGTQRNLASREPGDVHADRAGRGARPPHGCRLGQGADREGSRSGYGAQHRRSEARASRLIAQRPASRGGSAHGEAEAPAEAPAALGASLPGAAQRRCHRGRRERPQLLCQRPRLLVIAGQDSIRERCSKACYSLCPRGSASVRVGSTVSVGDLLILAVRRGRWNGFNPYNAHEIPEAWRPVVDAAAGRCCFRVPSITNSAMDIESAHGGGSPPARLFMERPFDRAEAFFHALLPTGLFGAHHRITAQN